MNSLPTTKRLRPKDVIRIVSKVYGVDRPTLTGRRRTATVAHARAVCGVLIRAHAAANGSEAARSLGRFPQMSVHWRKSVDARISTDPRDASRFAVAREECRHAMAQP